MHHVRLVSCFTLAVAISLVLPKVGKTADATSGSQVDAISVIVAYSAGGPVDLFARLVAKHLSGHLPGKPTMIVQNKPGAGGIVAQNYTYTVAKKDGSVILVTIAPFTAEYIGNRKIKFETDKFNWLGALNFSNAIYVNRSLGIKSPSELMRTDKQIVIGGLSPFSSRDLRMRAFLEAIGIKNYKYVTGYRGTNPIRKALLQNEVNFSSESVVALATDLAADVKSGAVIPISQRGMSRDGTYVRDPRLAEVPLDNEVIVSLKGKAARNSVEYRALNLVGAMAELGRAILAPPDVPSQKVETLRKGIASLNSDPAFQKDAVKLNGGTKLELIDGWKAQKFALGFRSVVTADREAHDFLNAMAAKKRGK